MRMMKNYRPLNLHINSKKVAQITCRTVCDYMVERKADGECSRPNDSLETRLDLCVFADVDRHSV